MKKLITLVLAMAMALSLVACGGDSSSNSGSNSGSNSQSNTQEGALKVALCMSGAVNDQGWNQSAYDGAKAACDKYGYELAYTENLNAADIAAAFADYAAASMSQTGTIGAIGPIQGDSLVKIVNGYIEGAKSVNPDIDVKTAWTNSYVDTQLAQESASAMIEGGTDVIKHCANACGNGAISAAVAADIWCQGDSYDQSSLAPDNILDSAIYNLDVVLDIALGTVADGSFEGGVYNLGMADGAVEVLISKNVPQEVADKAQATIDAITSGELVITPNYTVE